MILASMWLAKLSIEAIVGLIAASLAILAFVIDRVLGPATRLVRRRSEPRRLARALGGLRTGVQLQHFTDAIGAPPTRTVGNSNLYVLDDVFVDAETDDYGNVWRFAVTVRTASFKPTMSMGGGGDVVLGETTYADLGLDGVAQGLMVMQSPAGRHTMYAEAYYFGNPGNYRWWVLASNPASELGARDLRPILNELGAPDVAQFGAFKVKPPFGARCPTAGTPGRRSKLPAVHAHQHVQRVGAAWDARPGARSVSRRSPRVHAAASSEAETATGVGTHRGCCRARHRRDSLWIGWPASPRRAS